MSDKQKHPLIADLSQSISSVWPNVSDNVKSDIKAAVAAIEARLNSGDAALAALEQQPFPEARRVDWFKIYNEEAGVEVTCIFRANTDTEVERRTDEFLARRGIKTGSVWTSIDTKIEKRSEAKSERIGNYHDGHKEAQQALQAAPPATAQAKQANEEVFTADAIQLEPTQKSLTDKGLMWGVSVSVSKYPVRMYKDSALEAYNALLDYGIDTTKVVEEDGTYITHDLIGWKAHYTKDKNNKYPAKIVGLTPPQ